jgi:DNA-binding NtrC family response regulator
MKPAINPDKFQVLVVDDLEVQRVAIGGAVEATGLPVEVTYANSVASAKRKIREHRLPFDLLVLDLRLIVGAEGLDCVGPAKDRYRSSRTLIYTAHPTPETMRRAFKAGADDYISKLSDDSTGELQAAVKQLLLRSDEREALRKQREAQERAEAAYAEHRGDWESRYAKRWLLIKDGRVEKDFGNGHEVWEDLQSRPAAEQIDYGVIWIKGKGQ